MSDEPQYASAGEPGINKRKYEEQTTPPPRRQTGFSAPIVTASPDSAPHSYNSVPPPTDEIQLAKQRAQEIAARLFNASAGAAAAAAAGAPPLDGKRARVENGGGYDSSDNKGFSSAASDMKPYNSMPSSIPVSYGYQGASKKMDVPNGRVGVIIGKGGETIKYLQLQSGAKIQVTRDMDADLNSSTRVVELMGTPEQVAKAEQLITDVLAGAESGGQGGNSRRGGSQPGSEQFVMKVPNNKVGLVIGKGGETIKNMQARTGARIQVIPLHPPPGDMSNERTLQIDGTADQIESAKQLVNEVISENRPRNTGMSGGYQQQGFQPRPQTSWGAPGGAPPVQHPGYGYGQPGAYSGPQSQYNTQGYNNSGYTQPNSGGGYAPNWDHSAAPSAQQGGGAYDYYGQQQSAPQQQNPAGAGAGTDNSGYGYGQPPASGYQHGHGYSQEGFSGYHAPQPYGQPASYDQQQSYSAPDPQAPYGGESAQAPPSSQPQGGGNQPTYGAPPASQPSYGHAGYGAPQAQKPPQNPAAYGQSGQSPSTPGGYGQPPSYSHSQPDSGAQRGPPAGYGAPAAQPGFNPPPYGAPAGQPGYGQAQAYNAAYGGGYSQPPAYDAAAPAAQSSSQQGGASAKKSPQS